MRTNPCLDTARYSSAHPTSREIRDYTIPFPNYTIFAQSCRFYKKWNVRAVPIQIQFSGLGDLSELKHWLYAKLTWNPDADVDTLIDTYCKACFGPGAKHVREYIDIVEHARLRQRWTWFGCYVQDTSHFLTDEDCVRIYVALGSAPSEARRFLQGESPCRVRTSHPLVPSVGTVEEESHPNDIV